MNITSPRNGHLEERLATLQVSFPTTVLSLASPLARRWASASLILAFNQAESF